MPSYGPWTQDDDYTADRTYDDAGRIDKLSVIEGVNAFPNAWARHEYETDGGPDFVSDGVFMDLFDALLDNQPDIGVADNPQVTELRRNSGIITADPVVFQNYGVVAVGHSPYPICYGQEFYFPSDPPPGWVGIEWQDHPEWQENPFHTGVPERIGALLLETSEMRSLGGGVETGQSYTCKVCFADWGRAQEETYYGEASNPIIGETYLLSTDDRTTATGAGDFALGYQVDLSDLIREDSDVGGVLYTINEVFVPASGTPTYDMSWNYGVRFLRPKVRETYRPPVYRWVFDTEPYRQVWNRDDGLAGGAGQVWPRSKAVQSGNQVFGGIL